MWPHPAPQSPVLRPGQQYSRNDHSTQMTLHHQAGAKPGDQLGWAVVGFADETRLWWLRRLKPGFRHCFAYRWHPHGWLLLDPLSHRLDLDLIAPLAEAAAAPEQAPEQALDLAARLRLAGYAALTLPIRQPALRLAPPLPLSCVEVVKRLIGIHSWIICTPWQLYRLLRKYALDDSCVLDYSLFQQEQKAYKSRPKRERYAWFRFSCRRLAGANIWRQIMGGMFSSPSPAAVAPPAPPAETAAEAAANAARERRRRAQGETIATSYRGVESLDLQGPELGLADTAGLFARKTLIGE